MSNPKESGTLDQWISNCFGFRVIRPKTGSTGELDRWITNRFGFMVHQEGTAEAGAVSSVPIRQTNRIIHNLVR